MSESETKRGPGDPDPQGERDREHERRNELQAIKIQEAIARMRRRPQSGNTAPDPRGSSAGDGPDLRERTEK